MRYYILVQDYDSHWYVIPKDKEAKFSEYLYRLGEYYRTYDGVDESLLAPDEPDWAVRVGGSPSLVRFEEYVID